MHIGNVTSVNGETDLHTLSSSTRHSAILCRYEVDISAPYDPEGLFSIGSGFHQITLLSGFLEDWRMPYFIVNDKDILFHSIKGSFSIQV